MLKMLSLSLSLCLFLAIPAFSQITGTRALINQSGTLANIPVTCTPGQEYFASDQTPGKNVYGCTAGNVWTLQGDGTGTITAITQGCGEIFSTSPLVTTGTISAAGPCLGTGAGTAQAQTATYTPAITALTNGLWLCWSPSNANSSAAPTFAPDGLTAHTIVKAGGALVANDIITTAKSCAIYNTTGTQWELQNPQTGVSGLNISAVDTNITTTSLGIRAICALHTDSGCFNSVTDATAANCPAGSLSAPCTFPTSLTIPANALGSTVTVLTFEIGSLNTATIPTQLIELYFDSIRVYAGTSLVSVAGSKSQQVTCAISAATSTSTAPVSVGCMNNGQFGTNATFGANTLNTNIAPAIAIDATISHVLSVSLAYTSATTGNSAWLYGLKLSRDGVGVQGPTGPTGATGAAGGPTVTTCGTTSTCGNTAVTSARLIIGTAPLVSGTPSTVTVTGISPAFTSTTSFVCTVTGQTAAANDLLKVVNTSTSSITITGPNSITDVIGYQCSGN